MKFNIFELICIILLSLIMRKYIFNDEEKLKKDDYIMTAFITVIIYYLWVFFSNL
jgi:hypothetical protein